MMISGSNWPIDILSRTIRDRDQLIMRRDPGPHYQCVIVIVIGSDISGYHHHARPNILINEKNGQFELKNRWQLRGLERNKILEFCAAVFSLNLLYNKISPPACVWSVSVVKVWSWNDLSPASARLLSHQTLGFVNKVRSCNYTKPRELILCAKVTGLKRTIVNSCFQIKCSWWFGQSSL